MTTLEEQIPGGMTTASTTNSLVFEAPCCSSIRECNVKAHYVISVLNAKILRVIRAVRCYRGYTVKYKFYPSDDVILVHHYVSNRGVNYINLLWKPPNLSEDEALLIARKALGLVREIEI